MATTSLSSSVQGMHEPIDVYGDRDCMSETKRTDSQSAVIPQRVPQSAILSTVAPPLEGRVLVRRVANITVQSSEEGTHSPVEYDEGAEEMVIVPSAIASMRIHADSSPMPLIARRIAEFEQIVFPHLRQKPLDLDEGTSVLGQLHGLYREANQQNYTQESQRIKILINQLTPAVQEMNRSASCVTRRDLQTIGSFFSPPLEQFYTDPETNQTYPLADNSHLLSLALTAWAQSSCYSGVEVSKLYKVRYFGGIQAHKKVGEFSNLCDIIFFKKLEERFPRIEAFKDAIKDCCLSDDTRASGSRDVCKKQARLEQQEEVLLKAYEHLQPLYCSWNYLGFCTLQTETQLLSLNLPADSAKKYQAVCLFLKPTSK